MYKLENENEKQENKNSQRITPLVMISKIIKSSPMLFFINYMVKWLEEVANDRNIPVSKIRFEEDAGEINFKEKMSNAIPGLFK